MFDTTIKNAASPKCVNPSLSLAVTQYSSPPAFRQFISLRRCVNPTAALRCFAGLTHLRRLMICNQAGWSIYEPPRPRAPLPSCAVNFNWLQFVTSSFPSSFMRVFQPLAQKNRLGTPAKPVPNLHRAIGAPPTCTSNQLPTKVLYLMLNNLRSKIAKLPMLLLKVLIQIINLNLFIPGTRPHPR